MHREESSAQSSHFAQMYTFLWYLDSYPEQRDVHRAQVVCDGGVHTVLSLEVKEEPGHREHCDVGHHTEGIPTQGNRLL